MKDFIYMYKQKYFGLNRVLKSTVNTQFPTQLIHFKRGKSIREKKNKKKTVALINKSSGVGSRKFAPV